MAFCILAHRQIDMWPAGMRGPSAISAPVCELRAEVSARHVLYKIGSVEAALSYAVKSAVRAPVPEL